MAKMSRHDKPFGIVQNEDGQPADAEPQGSVPSQQGASTGKRDESQAACTTLPAASTFHCLLEDKT